MPVDTVINNCKIARHDGILDAGLAVDKGRIVAIAKDAELPSADTVIDGRGNTLIPGVVDAHVHLQYPPGVDPELNVNDFTVLPKRLASDPNHFAFIKPLQRHEFLTEFNRVLRDKMQSGEVQTIIDRYSN